MGGLQAENPEHFAEATEHAKLCGGHERIWWRNKAKRVTFATDLQTTHSVETTFKCIRASRCKVRRPEWISKYKSKYTVNIEKHPNGVML
jgi:hypothetical protein